MNKKLKRALIRAGIVAASVALTVGLANLRFFEELNLKAQDAQSVLRGKLPVKDIVILGVDQPTFERYPEPTQFWHKYYAAAIRGAAEAGAKVFVLDEYFAIPITRYEPDADQIIAQAFAEASPTMPIITAYVPEAATAQQNFVVPLNMMSAAMGTSAMANLTADSDDFVRRQELIEAPKAGVPTDSLLRFMALRAAEKFVGQDVQFRGSDMFLAGRRIVQTDRTIVINYAGPAGTVPRISLYKFIDAANAHNIKQLESWVKGKVVLLGPDNTGDRYDTPFYTFFTGAKATTPGVEIHANTLRTLLTGEYLQNVPQWARVLGLLAVSAACVTIVSSLGVSGTVGWSVALLLAVLIGTHLLFMEGWLFSASEASLTLVLALIGEVIYRFATAEKKSDFFKTAVAMFVGSEVASSLDKTEKIDLTGERRVVTILFTDIRGFTAFCESKDPAVVVDLLNVYMSTMVSIIVKYKGHVNKFIGDGILAVFSDDNPGALPGDHAWRTTMCATEMVSEVIGEFRTGAGLHTGEVVIGNVGSSDKMEFTVLGNTVNLASRLESLNKDQKTRLLMSEEAREMLGGQVDTIYLGAVPVKGKTEKMKLYTVTSLLEESRVAELRQAQQLAQEQPQHAEHVA